MTIGSSQGQMAGSNNIAHGGMTGRCGDSNTSNTRNAAKNMKKNLISLNHRGRGVVYVSHIPHGFYEAEMNDFFCQFGTITNLLLARSKETGKSRGYAYIEFMYAEIAKVVADTMHNYLMNERLLKAKFIPSEEFNVQLFYQKNPTEKNFPHQENRKLNTQLHNRDVPAMGEVKAQRKRESQHEDLMNKITNEKPDFTFKVSNIACEMPEEDVELPDEIGNKPVMVLDESDDEMQFKIPPDVILKEKRTGIIYDSPGPSGVLKPAEPPVTRTNDDLDIIVDKVIRGGKEVIPNEDHVINVEDDILDPENPDVEDVERKVKTFITSAKSMTTPNLILSSREVEVVYKALKQMRRKEEELHPERKTQPGKVRRRRLLLLNSLKKKKKAEKNSYGNCLPTTRQQTASSIMTTRSGSNTCIDPSVSRIKKKVLVQALRKNMHKKSVV